MIIDLSAGATRRKFVASGAPAWSFSFSVFGAAVTPATVYRIAGKLVNVGHMQRRTY